MIKKPSRNGKSGAASADASRKPAASTKRKVRIRVKPGPAAKSPRKPRPASVAKSGGGERRILGRRRLLWLGKLRYADHKFDCKIFDLSLGGAKVKLDLPLKRGTQVMLTIPEVGVLAARVAWSKDGKIALAFSEDTAAVRKKLAAKAAKLGLN